MAHVSSQKAPDLTAKEKVTNSLALQICTLLAGSERLLGAGHLFSGGYGVESLGIAYFDIGEAAGLKSPQGLLRLLHTAPRQSISELA
jgi:hypothetical protein